MLFRKFLIGFAALALILMGGAGTQSGSLLAQGGGFIGLLIGLIVLYIFVKMLWRAMGCLPSAMIFIGILSFILYAIGGFNNGVGGVGKTIQSFFGQTTEQAKAQIEAIEEDVVGDIQPTDEDTNAAPMAENNGFSGIDSYNVFSDVNIRSEENTEGPEDEEPEVEDVVSDGKTIIGPAQVLRGDVLSFRGVHFFLYGIDAPEANQTCADRRGRSYNCGQIATKWLKKWIIGQSLNCRIMQRNKKGEYLGICSLGDYDIGAAMVNAGWALAHPKNGKIYLPYQQEAQRNRNGLWQGNFYTPWDWRKMASKKPKIKVVDTDKNIFGF